MACLRLRWRPAKLRSHGKRTRVRRALGWSWHRVGLPAHAATRGSPHRGLSRPDRHRPEAAVAWRAWEGRREVRTDAASARRWLADVTPAYLADHHRVGDGSIRLDLTWDSNRKQRSLVRTWPPQHHRHADIDHLRGIRLRLSATVVPSHACRNTRIPTSSWTPCSTSSVGSSDASRTASRGGGSEGA
jgi:hypothetical protein